MLMDLPIEAWVAIGLIVAFIAYDIYSTKKNK